MTPDAITIDGAGLELFDPSFLLCSVCSPQLPDQEIS
jgi:hypothetical protein